LIEDIFFSIELSSAEHMHGLSPEDFQEIHHRESQKKVQAAEGAGFLLELEKTAKRRVKEWIE
jgi:hypothetical protein